MQVLTFLKRLLKSEPRPSAPVLRRQLSVALQEAYDAREHKWNMEASEYQPLAGPSPELQDACAALQKAEEQVRYIARRLHTMTTDILSA